MDVYRELFGLLIRCRRSIRESHIHLDQWEGLPYSEEYEPNHTMNKPMHLAKSLDLLEKSLEPVPGLKP